MATCTLTLYTGCKLSPEKNFIVDNLTAYLGTLTSTTITSFQYQRFELNKTIKVDLDQLWQTNASNLTYNQTTIAKKWNYCSLSTVKDSTTIYYYYFITGYKQIAQKTIELTLVMDTINTFSYSGTYANNTYTLSSKTVVKREHKDRFKKSVAYTDSALPFRIVAHLPVYTEDPVVNKHYAPQIQWVIDNQDQEQSETFGIGLGVGHSETRYTVTLYNSDGSLHTTLVGHNSIVVTPYDDSVDFTFTLLDDTTELVEVFPNQYLIITFNKLSSNSTALAHVADFLAFVNMRGNAELYYKREIDYYKENISSTLFKKSEETLFDNDSENQWYVVYASAAAPATGSEKEANYVNPVKINFYSDSGYTITTNSSAEVTIYAQDSKIPRYTWEPEYIYNYSQVQPSSLGEQYFIINGVTYDLYDYKSVTIQRKNNNDNSFYNAKVVSRLDVTTTISTPFPYFIVYGLNQLAVKGEKHGTEFITVNSGPGTKSGTCNPWNKKDLSDAKLIKAFAFPYAPTDFLVGKTSVTNITDPYTVSSSDNSLEVLTIQDVKFSYQKTLPYISPLKDIGLNVTLMDIGQAKTRSAIYESKLYSSDYYQPKFVYDSFSYPFNLETIDVDKVCESWNVFNDFTFTYTVSRNILSKFMFTFDECYYKLSTQDYDNILLVDRNNEKALYNNAYINYIKSGGYNNDAQKAQSQNAINGISTALSIIGAVASFASSGVTGAAGVAAGVSFATAAASGIARSIQNAQQQDQALSQKLNEMQLQGTSVVGSEDVDLLTQFSNNKPKLVYYGLSDIMKNAMWDLFHYCGYATYEQKKPTHDSRLYFNFVQADIIYDEYNFNEEIAEDIKAKWANGVTFLHKVNTTWDFDQSYENWETSLI